MRDKLQHMLPKKLNFSRRIYSKREISLAYDLRERTYNSETFDSSTQDSAMISLKYSTDGDYIFLLGDTNDKIFGYSLCPYFDVTSAVLDDSLDFSAKTTSPIDFVFQADGLTVGIVTATGVVHEYTLTVAWDLGTATFNQTINTYTTTGVVNVTVDADGDYIVITSTGLVYNVSTPTIVNAFDIVTGYAYDSLVVAIGATRGGMQFLLGGTYLFTIQELYGGIYYRGVMYKLSIAYDVSTAVLDSVSPMGFAYGSTGTYINPTGTDIVSLGSQPTHYTISPALDLANTVLHCTSDTMSPAPTSVCFNPSGNRAYYLAGGYLVVANLSQAWKLSTGSIANSYAYTATSNETIKISFLGDYIYIGSDYHEVEQWIFTDYNFGEELSSEGIVNLTSGPNDAAFWDMSEDGSQYIGKSFVNGNFYYYDIGTKTIQEENGTALGSSLVSPGYPGNASTFYALDTSAGSVAAYFLQSPGSAANMDEQYDTTITEFSMTNVGAMDVGSDGGNAVFLDTTTGIIYQLRIP